MLHIPDPTHKKKMAVYDAMNKQIPWVTSYDDETQEAEVLIYTGERNGMPTFAVGGGQVIKARVALPGSRIVVT